MLKFKGLWWAGIEHRWERYTNIVLFIGITTSILLYMYNIYYAEVGIAFLVLAGFCHLIARLSHSMEKRKMKDYRPWARH